jgi:hemoglobin/transferrin/lactoferrin receptor protein
MRPALVRFVSAGAVMTCAAISSPLSLNAQATDSIKAADSTRAAVELEPLTVTATRELTRAFNVPAPVDVLDTTVIRRAAPHNAVDLFRDRVGLDVNGIGPNQTRPTIRGQRGQRVLLMEDGVRLNNSRRQQDFGELPALVDVSGIQQVEVVRGPSSVLYGTDAIGGVVNLITRTPSLQPGVNTVHGTATYRYGTDGDLQRGNAMISGQQGRFGFLLGGFLRDAGNYDAPKGSFGNVRLKSETRVHDSGVRDRGLNGYLGYALGGGNDVYARAEVYRADSAGFGYVDPAVFGPFEPFVQIRYPQQDWQKYTLGFNGTRLRTPVTDRVSVVGYYQSNKRDLAQNIFVPFGPGTPPGAGVQVNAANFTDLKTAGFRVEAAKLIGLKNRVTYGTDFFRDVSENTDSSTTAILGFGPIPPTTSTVPNVPNASFRSFGVFVQDQIWPIDRLSIVVGGRYQSVQSKTRETPGVTDPLTRSTNNTFVGAANAIYGLTSNINLVGSVGRGFRAPNLVEQFFNGPTPEGNGFQSANPGLKPETSLNVDLGAKLRWKRFYAEAFVFQNTLREGIRIAPTGDSVGPFPEYQNVNIDRLRYRGVEASLEAALVAGFTLTGGYSYITSKDVSDNGLAANDPVGTTYSSKVNLALRYRHASGRFWGEYALRINGEQKDVVVGTNPVGPTLPGFTVQNLRGGIALFQLRGVPQELSIGVLNLGNKLYSEVSNTSFFRPQPKRTVYATWTMGF